MQMLLSQGLGLQILLCLQGKGDGKRLGMGLLELNNWSLHELVGQEVSCWPEIYP